jgi:hypothetical protein
MLQVSAESTMAKMLAIYIHTHIHTYIHTHTRMLQVSAESTMAKMLASYSKWAQTGGPEEDISKGNRLGESMHHVNS